MEVTIVVSPTLAETLQRGDLNREDPLNRAVHGLGVTLEAVHPGTADPLLTPYYRVEATDPTHAETIANELRGIEGVEGAYVKPDAAMP